MHVLRQKQSLPAWAGRGLGASLPRVLKRLLPPVCLRCANLLQSSYQTWLCADCIRGLRPNLYACPHCGLEYDLMQPSCRRCLSIGYRIDTASVPWCYDSHLAKLIHAWKSQGRVELTATLATLMLAIPDYPKAPLVPIPTHWRRRWHRGFDQTWLLSHAVQAQARHRDQTELSVLPLLKRLRHTPKQQQQRRKERWLASRQLFELSRDQTIPPAITLLDDVITTGATVSAATEVLRRAGVEHISLWCIASTATP